MYHNTHLPVMSLDKAPVKSGGLCSIRFAKWEDVKTWPQKDPLTGILSSSLELKEGAVLYFCQAIDQSRSFSEKQKQDSGGKYFEIAVIGSLKGSNGANILSAEQMLHHQWAIILEDRNGYSRLIGDRDTGADFIYDYDSGNINNSRKTDIAWKWEHPTLLPIYSGEAFDIIIGGITITAGCIIFIKRFEVGAAGSPMNEGDTIFSNAGILGKKVLVMVDGIGLPVDDFSGDIDWTGSIQRRVEKALASNTINFVGGVVNEEKIEIYAFT